jgi:predicted metal-dependent hydrolase
MPRKPASPPKAKTPGKSADVKKADVKKAGAKIAKRSIVAKAFAPKKLPESVELLDGRIVPLRVVVNPRAKRIGLCLDAARREAVAVAPTQRLAPKAAAFAIDRAGWIAMQLNKLPRTVHLEPGAVIPLRGAPHHLVMVKGRTAPHIIPAREGEPARIVAGAPDAEAFASRVRRFLVAEAKAELSARVAQHARTLGVTWKTLSVKDTTSRWGSCTEYGALSFSWRVVLAPPQILDYLAAHETAHLRELNHSKRYWAQVKKCFPDYDGAEAWLRKHGAALHAIAPRL